MPSSSESQGRRPTATPLPANYAPKLTRQAKQLIERIRQDQHDEEAVQELKAYYESLGDQPSLANLLEGWGAVLPDPQRAAEAFMEASEAVLAGTGDLGRARYLCERALARQPSHPGALNRLCKLLEADRDYVHLEQRLRFLAGALRASQHDPHYLAQVLYRLGQVHHHSLGQPAAARRAYRAALELNPRFVPCIVAARQLYLESESYAAAAVLYEMQIAATDAPDDRAMLWAELARLRAGPLDEPDSAILAYRRSLRERPDHVLTLDELSATLLSRAARGTAEQSALDQARAAHVLYQTALLVPRSEAAARLQRCVQIEPTHARALGMLRELASYGGAADAGVDAARTDRSQAALDAQSTSRITPERVERVARTAAGQPAPAPSAEEEWLTTGELEPVLPTDTGRLGPITEPPPPATAEVAVPRSTAADLAARLRRAREQAAARRSWLPPAIPVEAVAVAAAVAPVGGVEDGHEDGHGHGHEDGDGHGDGHGHGHGHGDGQEREEAVLVDTLVEELGRMPVEVNLGATTEANLFASFDNRVRAGGVFVPTYAPLPEGTPLLLQLTLPGGYETRAHGRVRFVRDAFDFTAEEIPGMGVKFEALTPEALALCERFAQKRPPMFFDD